MRSFSSVERLEDFVLVSGRYTTAPVLDDHENFAVLLAHSHADFSLPVFSDRDIDVGVDSVGQKIYYNLMEFQRVVKRIDFSRGVKTNVDPGLPSLVGHQLDSL